MVPHAFACLPPHPLWLQGYGLFAYCVVLTLSHLHLNSYDFYLAWLVLGTLSALRLVRCPPSSPRILGWAHPFPPRPGPPPLLSPPWCCARDSPCARAPRTPSKVCPHRGSHAPGGCSPRPLTGSPPSCDCRPLGGRDSSVCTLDVPLLSQGTLHQLRRGFCPRLPVARTHCSTRVSMCVVCVCVWCMCVVCVCVVCVCVCRVVHCIW